MERQTFVIDIPVDVPPRCVVNAFPKSGTHLTARMIAGFLPPAFEDRRVWTSTFKHNSWSADWVDIEKPIAKLQHMPAPSYYKAHIGYRDEIADVLRENQITTLFIYRDLRDVAVSAAFHAISEEDERFLHPGKELFRNMDSFEDVLEAIIVGVDVYDGLFDRWELYAPWLEQRDWVSLIRFEDILSDPVPVASAILKHLTSSVGFLFDPEDHMLLAEAMAKQIQDHNTATFRKGTSGEWRKYFTPRITKLFKERAGDWLARLGYEE